MEQIATDQMIVDTLTSSRFWTIAVTLVSAVTIGWMLLHSGADSQSILLPDAEQIVILNNDLSPNEPYHTVQGNNYSFFLEQEYKIILAGRSDNMVRLVGITNNNSAYFYEQKIAPKPALFSTIKNMHREDEILQVETGRDWKTRMIFSVFTALLAFMIVVYFTPSSIKYN